MNLLDLFVKISVDKGTFDQDVGEAEAAGVSLGSKLKGGLAVAAKAAAAGLAATATAAVALGKAALSSYAEYEQLVGGVDTLFKDSSKKLQEYANNAYATAGMSANEYMSTVTSFSAALINSVGGDTEKAADMADRALTDMADNANKMGTDIDSIVATYQSLSRGNFAMLDNLKLGYGGTKAELERLLDDAEAYKRSMGEIVDYDINNFADIVSGIGAIQEKMGIAGATAAEAATTIEGSVASMKSAWSNLVAGLGNENADLGQLTSNLVNSIVTVGSNVIPRVKVIAENMARAVVELAPRALEGGVALIENVGKGLFVGLPEMLRQVPSMVFSFANAVLDNLPVVFDSFVTFVTENLPVFAESGMDVLFAWVEGIIEGLPELTAKIPEVIRSFVKTIRENLPQIISAGFDLLMKFGDGIINAIPGLVERLPEIVSAILEGLDEAVAGAVSIGVDIVEGLWEGIVGMAGWIGDKVSGFLDNLFGKAEENEEIASPSKKWARIGRFDAAGYGAGWEDEFDRVNDRMANGFDTATASVDFAASGLGIASAGIVNGISAVGAQGGPMTVNLMFPDGTNFARYILPNMIDVARDSGTPILNPA